jgi:DNA-binding beta-propeller fold protein YncE
MHRFVLLLLLVLCAAPILSAQSYEVTHTYTVGGDGGWDYVTTDAPNHRLFIGRQNRVMVVDMNDGHLIAEVPGIDGAHGVVVAPGTGRGFATSGEDSSVVMFDLRTYKTLARIPAGDDADAIIYDPSSSRVISFNGDANPATVIDPKRRQRLFSGCRSGVLAVSDYKNGKVITTIPIGRGVDGAGYDPVRRDVYTSNGEGTLTVIHQDSPDSYRVVENVQTAQESCSWSGHA